MGRVDQEVENKTPVVLADNLGEFEQNGWVEITARTPTGELAVEVFLQAFPWLEEDVLTDRHMLVATHKVWLRELSVEKDGDKYTEDEGGNAGFVVCHHNARDARQFWQLEIGDRRV